MTDQTAEALVYLADRSMQQGDRTTARWLYEGSLVIWRALGHRPGIAHVVKHLRKADGKEEKADGHAGSDQ
jgi:hypothetical protein